MTKAQKYAHMERLSFPKYGQIGYDDQVPVGRKHLSTKLSHIHKIIFNEEVKLPPRKVYNSIKMNPIQDKLSESNVQDSPQYHRNQSLQYYPQKDVERTHKFDIMQRRSIEDSLVKNQPSVYINDFLQRQSQQLLNKSSNKKHYFQAKQRLDSLDKIIDPYKNYEAMQRQRKSFNENQSFNYSQLDRINKGQQFEQGNNSRVGVISPTFLNSML